MITVGFIVLAVITAIAYLRRNDEVFSRNLMISAAMGAALGGFVGWLNSGVVVALEGLPVGALAVSLLFVLTSPFLGKKSGHEHVRGTRLLDAHQLRAATRKSAKTTSQKRWVEIGRVAVPPDVEPVHFLMAGSPGSGKSVAINQIIFQARQRGDRMIIADPGGEAMARFWKEGDAILNPLDRRSVRWSPFAEIRDVCDTSTLAKSIIPDGSGSSSEWNLYSQQVVSAILKRQVAAGQTTNADFLQHIAIASMQELAELVQGTPAARLLNPEVKGMAGSVLGVLGAYAAVYADALDHAAGAADFSIRKWVEDESQAGVLWIPYQINHRAMLAPLVGAWLDIAVSSVLSLRPSRERNIWLVADELPLLSKINSLVEAATNGRRYSLRLVCGLQAVSQLQKTYGTHDATTILSSLRSWLILNQSDAETAEAMSKGIGEQEVIRVQTSSSKNSAGSSESATRQWATQKAVLPSELLNLPKLEGFLRLAEHGVARVKLRPMGYPEVTQPFIKK